MVKPSRRGPMVERLVGSYLVSERRACHVQIRVLLNREGWNVGKHLVYRLYKEEGLTLKRMKPAGKRKASRQREEKLRLPRATYRYKSCLDPRTELRMRIREIAQARVRYGYRKSGTPRL